jgi:HEPN domain-containing protein
MAITREEFKRQLYYRVNGDGRRLCKCRKCGRGPVSIVAGAVSSEPCDNEDCGAIDWRDLTEEEFVSDTTLMSDLLTLPSSYLASKIGDLYESDVESEEWIKSLKKLVEGLEGFGDEATARWLRLNIEKYPKIVEYLLDEFYSRDFLKKARKIVDRTIQLTAMIPKSTPDKGVNLYLREATRCYIGGFWESSVALSRTTLEIALRHRLEEGQGFLPTDDKFETVIEYAYLCRVIDHVHHEMAEDVRKKGNDVVHGSPTNEEIAGRVLSSTRGVLDYLYSR